MGIFGIAKRGLGMLGKKKVSKTISSVKPGAKIGAKSVSEWKNKASLSTLKSAGDSAVQRIKDTAKSLGKLNETLKKQKNIMDK